MIQEEEQGGCCETVGGHTRWLMRDATLSGERRLTEIEYKVVCHLAEAGTLDFACMCTYGAYTARGTP
jgi:hypothetical protein